MSRIGHAKTLARLISRHLDALPDTDAAEVRRVYNMTLNLVAALEDNFVSQVSQDGMDALTELADILLSDKFHMARDIAATIQVGDKVEVTDPITGERTVVTVYARPDDITHGFTLGASDRTPFRMNLFWSDAKRA